MTEIELLRTQIIANREARDRAEANAQAIEEARLVLLTDVRAAEARATAAEAALFAARQAVLTEGLARTAAEGERDALRAEAAEARGREKALRGALVPAEEGLLFGIGTHNETQCKSGAACLGMVRMWAGLNAVRAALALPSSPPSPQGTAGAEEGK